MKNPTVVLNTSVISDGRGRPELELTYNRNTDLIGYI